MTTLGNLQSDSNSYFEALATAERRALHSFFDQHVVEDDDLGYFALDEGDYNALPAHLGEPGGAYGAWRNARRVLSVQ